MSETSPSPLQLTFQGKLRTIEAIIFDLDGTLYDKRPLKWYMISRLWYQLYSLHLYDKTRKQMVGRDYQTAENLLEHILEHLAPNQPNTQQKWKTWIETKYFPTFYQGFQRTAQAYPKAAFLIDKLRESGLKLACVSDYPQVGYRLQSLGINPGHFDFLFGTEEHGMMKPAPRVAKMTLEHLRIPASDCLVIGDREDTDHQMALKDGMAFIGILSDSTHTREPDETWSHWPQVLDRLLRALDIDPESE